MPLTSGTRLGSYQVLDPLGSGGMGHVYRARDTKLGRDVALKVLPDSVIDDAERIARFRRDFAKMGRRAEAAEVMSTFEQIACERFVAPFHFALLHAGLGNREIALEYLEQSVKLHAGPFVLMTTDPLWDDWRSEPRFQALMQRCGFPTRDSGSITSRSESNPISNV